MSLPASIQALLTLWPDLPQRLGDEWPRLYWQLLDLLRAFEQAADEETRASVSLRLMDLLVQLPGGREALRRATPREARTRGGKPYMSEDVTYWSGKRSVAIGGDVTESVIITGERPYVATLNAHLQALLHPPTVTRYTDVYAPSQVVVGERFPIIVGLTRGPAEGPAAAIQAQLNELIRVVLTPRGPELLSEPAKTLRVEEGESEPVVFYLRTVHVGTQSVLIDFYSTSHLLASITHTLTAEEAGIVSPLGKLPAKRIDLKDYRIPYPGLVLRVSTRGNRLTYTLNYADSTQRIFQGGTLRADPERYRYQIIREIENLARGLDVDDRPLDTEGQPSPQVFFRHLERIGHRLYDELFSQELRREYRERIRDRVGTLEIVSDEPWIPWELVKPYDAEWEDDFLCLQYDFSRWVSDGEMPAAEIAVDSLACVAPGDSGLSFAQQEKAAICSLAQQFNLTDLTPTRARRADVEALLEGETPIHLWHFACHGNFDADAPGNSPLILEGQQRLRPNDLAGPKVKRRLSTDRPFVFLNACRVGQSGLSLTGLGGWAARLVGECRVGALLAPLWSVNDLVAYEFARAFYEASQEGMTLAAALRRAREKIKKAYPNDPTWLAYSLYAHPNARLAWRRRTP